MKKFLKILKDCPLFFGIGEEELSRMLGCLGARVLSFDRKYTVMAEGSAAHYVGILLSGAAQVIRHDYDGNRTVLSELRPPALFAEAFACAEVCSLPVSVIATEPSEVMLVDCRHILRTCQNGCAHHHRLIYNLMKDLAEKSLTLHRRAQIVSCRTTRDKLLTYLSFVSREHGSTSFDIPFDRQALADYLEVDRSGLSAEIGKLRREGVLDSHKRHFELLAPHAER